MKQRFLSICIPAASAILALAVVVVGATQLGPRGRTASAGVLVAGTRATSTATKAPPPTATPNAPGIVVAPSQGFDMPDPYLVAADGQYVMYLSTAFGDPTPRNVPLLVGVPGHWSPVSDALPEVPSWALPASAGGKVWDPQVVFLGGRYLMYSAPQLRDQFRATHCLGLATSTTPDGPFVPVPGPPLVCQTSLGGDIDAQVFTDPEGPGGPRHPYYLLWKSDDNNLDRSNPTTIWVAPLANDGLSITGAAVQIFHPGAPWENPVLEAPEMVKAPNGTDWLFFSGGSGFFTPRYAMGAAQCAGPLGGCHDVSAAPLIATNDQGAGPGEETAFVAADGSTWLLYSPWHTDIVTALLRPVEAARIGWDASGPYVAEAGTFPLPTPAIGLQVFDGAVSSRPSVPPPSRSDAGTARKRSSGHRGSG